MFSYVWAFACTLCVTSAHTGQKRVSDSGTRVTGDFTGDGWWTPRGSWEPNPNPLQEQWVFLMAVNPGENALLIKENKGMGIFLVMERILGNANQDGVMGFWREAVPTCDLYEWYIPSGRRDWLFVSSLQLMPPASRTRVPPVLVGHSQVLGNKTVLNTWSKTDSVLRSMLWITTEWIWKPIRDGKLKSTHGCVEIKQCPHK